MGGYEEQFDRPWRWLEMRSGEEGFPGGPVVKNRPCNAGDTGLVPGLGRFHMPCGTKPMCCNYRASHLEPMLQERSRGNEESEHHS